MTIVRPDAEGLREAGRVLDVGGAIVLPLPTPLPYVVAARDATAVNVAKGRSATQPAGMTVADLARVAPHLDLDAETLAFARWLSGHELLNLLLPVAVGAPGWMRPSTSNGWLGVTLACLPETRELLERRGHLYLSSANRTRGRVAVTAEAADAAFAGELLVVDGDAHRDPAAASGSATMVRVARGGRLEIVRHGVNDAAFAGDAGRYLRELTRRWERANAAP